VASYQRAAKISQQANPSKTITETITASGLKQSGARTVTAVKKKMELARAQSEK